HPELEAIYYGGGLPLAGVSGTLAASNGRFTTKPTVCALGKISAKTGTLFDTIGLSGLTVGTDGRLKAFSILVNSRPQSYSPLATRKQVDRLAATVNGCY
ncbi:MAG: D-alanyl-D-alanine carboxypeptidase, partial [Actinomycetes bacterium]